MLFWHFLLSDSGLARLQKHSGKPASCSPEQKEILSLVESVIKRSIRSFYWESLSYILSLDSRNSIKKIVLHTRIVSGTIKWSVAVVYINALVIEIYFVIKPRARMGLTHVSLQWQFNLITNHFHFFIRRYYKPLQVLQKIQSLITQFSQCQWALTKFQIHKWTSSLKSLYLVNKFLK